MTHATEQLLASTHAAVADFFGAANHGLAGLEKLVELNLQATRSALADTHGQVRAALDARSTEDLIAIAAWPQPLVQKAAAWSQAVADITLHTGSHLAQVTEGRLAEVQARVAAVAANAPTTGTPAVQATPAAAQLGMTVVEARDDQAADGAAALAQTDTPAD